MVDSPKSSRRQFLQGRAAVDAIAHFGDQLEFPAAPWEDSVAETYLVKYGRQAMACDFEVSVNAGQYPDAAAHCLAALDLVDRLEAQLTVYRDTSEIVDINRRAGHAPVEQVEPKLFELLQTAQRIYAETQGAFDITAGPLVKAWGFFRRQGAVPSEADLAAALRCVGGDNLRLDATRRSVAFAAPGMELNLGSIGKGYALDRCGEHLEAAGIDDFFMHGGQSSVLRAVRGPASRQIAAVGSLAYPTRCALTAGWRKSASKTGRWPRRAPQRNSFVTRGDDTGTFSIRAAVNPRPECSR